MKSMQSTIRRSRSGCMKAVTAGITAFVLAVLLVALPNAPIPAIGAQPAHAKSLTAGSIEDGGSSETYATVTNGTYQIACTYGSKVIDVPAASTVNNQAVKTYTSNGTLAQRFVITCVASNTYTIQVGCSGKYLCDKSGTVVQQTKSSASTQRWRFVKSGSYVAIKNVSTGRYITVGSAANGASLTTKAASNDSKQLFKISSASLIAPGYYTLKSMTGTRMLDVSAASTTNNANVQIYSDNGTNAQKWQFISVGDGSYWIVNAASNKALAVKGSSSVSGANVVQYTRGDSKSQKWKASVSDSGGIVFVNMLSGFALNVIGNKSYDGANVNQNKVNATATGQRWALISTSKISQSSRSVNVGINVTEVTDYNGVKYVNIPNGTYTVKNVMGRYLDVSAASTSDGANVQIWSGNGTVAQGWTFRSLGNGYYEIYNVNSNKALDVLGGATGNGANVQQFMRNNTGAQKWQAVIQNNALVFVNVNSGRVLDVSAGLNVDGANVQIWDRNNTNAQRWKLSKYVAPVIVNVAPANSFDRAVALDIFNAYNNYRASKGLNRVQWDNTCLRYADDCALGCARINSLQHRLGIPAAMQYSYSDILQYATWKKTGQEAIARWDTSDGHRRQMQCPSATKAAVSVYRTGNVYYYVIVYDFVGCNQTQQPK